MKAYTLGVYEKAMPGELTWRERLEAAKDAGYDFLEISIDETNARLARLDWTKEERLELINTMYDTGVPIRTMCLSGHRKYPIGSSDEATCAKGMEIMEKAILLAADLGIRLIQLAGYDVYYEESTSETVARFGENLKKCEQMAAAAGVLLGFETMETEFMNTVGKAMVFVNRLNSPYLGIYPDMGNITNSAAAYGTDVLEDIRKGRGHLDAVHLKETVPGVFREVAFGTGHVDFPAVIEEAWRAGVRRYVTEFWYTGNPRWRDEMRQAARMMREILNTQERKMEEDTVCIYN